MAKISAPLLSMGATGTIGKSVTFAKWRGVAYARQRVIPSNPQTTAQQANRALFAFLREMWKLGPTEVRAPWDAFAAGQKFTGMNKIVGENVRLIGADTDLLNSQMSPGAKGGLPPAGVVVTQGAATGDVDVTITPPAQLPVGWTVNSCAAAACIQQDPHGLFSGAFVAASDAVAPYAITLDVGVSNTLSMAWGWVIYNKPDGSLAYSVSIGDEALSGV